MTAYGPGQGPGPKPVGEDDLARLLGEQQFAVLATTKKSGHPHLSTVVYTWDPAERIVRISTTAGRAKVRQIRNDPRAALHASAPDHLSFAVAEGRALVERIAAIRADWDAALSGLRADHSGRRLAALAVEQPVLNAPTVAARLDVGPPAAYRALEALVDRGVLRPANSQRRNRIWIAEDVIEALDGFAARAARRG